MGVPAGAFSSASMYWWACCLGSVKLSGPICMVSGMPKSAWSVKQTSAMPRCLSARAISAMRFFASKEQVLCT